MHAAGRVSVFRLQGPLVRTCSTGERIDCGYGHRVVRLASVAPGRRRRRRSESRHVHGQVAAVGLVCACALCGFWSFEARADAAVDWAVYGPIWGLDGVVPAQVMDGRDRES